MFGRQCKAEGCKVWTYGAKNEPRLCDKHKLQLQCGFDEKDIERFAWQLEAGLVVPDDFGIVLP